MPLIPRGIEPGLRDILGASRAAAITGPRQVGKSTLARQLKAAFIRGPVATSSLRLL
jgi:predicted AAA+ superfamily ATPase